MGAGLCQGPCCTPAVPWRRGGGHRLTPPPAQPTVRFAEDTLLSGPEDEGPGGQPETGGRQRLIRKDTPHYKKHFRICALPQPQAVVALLQGTPREGPGLPGDWHNGPLTAWAPRAQAEEEEEEEEGEPSTEEEDKEEEATPPAPSVKVSVATALVRGLRGRQQLLLRPGHFHGLSHACLTAGWWRRRRACPRS